MSSCFRVIIPARLGSTRLPGKLLLDIAGKSMIQHVYERALQSGAQSVVIATDSAQIAEVAAGWGAPFCMTDACHKSGTDRLAEAAALLGYDNSDIVVNVQGDEPLIPPTIIPQVARNLAEHPAASMATLSAPIHNEQELFDPNVVKVVTNEQGYALYFSRAPIPWDRQHFPNKVTLLTHWQRHVGIYAYRVGFLKEFTSWNPCLLEELESLEQLRILWHDKRIQVAQAAEPVPLDVNTEEDLRKVSGILLSRG